MSQDKKYREFWLAKDDPTDPLNCPDRHAYTHQPMWDFAKDSIHVIEIAALDELKAEIERLKKENEALRTKEGA